MARVSKGMVYKGISVDPNIYPKFMMKCRRGGTTGRFILQKLMEVWIDESVSFGTRGFEVNGQVIVKAYDHLKKGELPPTKTDAEWDAIEKSMGKTMSEVAEELDAKEAAQDTPIIEKAVPDYVGRMPGKTVSLEEVKRKLAKEAA